MSIAAEFRDIERFLRTKVLAWLEEEVPYTEIARRVNKMLRDAGLVGANADELLSQVLKEAGAQYEWVTGHTASQADRDALTTILETSGSDFARIGGEVEQGTLKIVSRAIREGLPQREIEDLLVHGLRRPKAEARTVANSALQGFGRANTFHLAEKAGVQHFRFTGPPGERPFCIRLLAEAAGGKVWTLEEIAAMDNGQGLSVRYYCGGYNCRHHWEMVIEEIEKLVRSYAGR